jgi:TP901 family phage tail tape measure protein
VAVVGELLVILGGSNAALTSTLAKSEAELRAFSGTATTHGAHAAGGLHTVGVAALGVAGLVGVMGVASIKAAADFQEQMGIINTIAKQSPHDLDQTGQAIRRLSTESGTGLGDLTQGFYDLLSAGVPATKAMDALRQANTLAIGGLATTAQTVDLITTAINSYSLNTKQSAVATDQFALAVQDGKVTAAQIASTFADVAPLAHSMGIGIDEVSATYAVLTARGVPAAEAMTQMNRAMVELQKPNADLADLQTKLHVKFADVAAHKGLVEALNEMRSAAEANGVPFQNLFGRLEGYKFALATTGPEAKAYADELTKMHDATGTAAGQAAERMQTFDRQAAILGNSLQSLMIGIGTAFLPALTSIVSSVSAAVQSFSDWSDANPGLAGAILAVVGAVAALTAGVVFLGPVVGAVAGTFAILLGPIGLVIAAIAGLAIAWQSNWLGIRDVVEAVIGAVAPIIATLGDLVSTVGFAIANGLNAGSVAAEAFREGPFGQIGSFVSDVVGGLADLVSTVGAAIAEGLNPGSVAAEAFLEGPFGQIGSFVRGVVGTLAGLGSSIAAGLGEVPGVLSGIAAQLSSGLSAAFAALPGVIGPGIAAAQSAFAGLAGAASSLGSAIGSFLGDAGNQQTILNGISSAASTAGSALSALAGIISNVAAAIASFVGNANNQRAALTGIQTAAQAVSAVLSALASMVMQAVGAIVAFVTNANNQATALRIVGAAGDAVRAVLGALATAVAVVVGWFSNFASHLMGTGNQAKTMGDALSTVGAILTTIARIVGTVVGAVATLAAYFLTAANDAGIFKIIGDAVYNLFGLLGTAVRTLFTQLADLAGIVTGALTGAFNALVSVFNTIRSAIDAAAKAIQGLIDNAKKAVDAVAAIPGVKLGADVVGGVGGVVGGAAGGVGDVLGHLPHFAGGGIIQGSGPTLAMLHPPEAIIPLGAMGNGTASPLPSGGGERSGAQVHETHIHVHLDGKQITEVVERNLFRNASTYSSGFLANSGIVGA